MATWKWIENFVDQRECTVEADTEEEAREKMQAGDWSSETTIDFYSLELVSDLTKEEEQ